MINGISVTYAQLSAKFPPRPITSDKQFWATQDQIDALLDKGQLTSDEQDYLTALGMMVERYEDENEPEISLRGIDLIRALMEEQNLKQRDLVAPVFKTDSIASAVLNGKRRLTVEHIDKLAAYFALPHVLFFELTADDSPVVTPDEDQAAKNEPIGPRPQKHTDPFKDFINQMGLDKWQAETTGTISIKKFQMNNQRLQSKT